MEEVTGTDPLIEKLNERLARKNKEIEILANIFSQMRGALDLDVILNRILEQLDYYFSFRHSMVLLASKGNYLRVVASHGYPVKGMLQIFQGSS